MTSTLDGTLPHVSTSAFSRFRSTPWWVQVLVIFAASRVVTTVIMLVFASLQAANAWTGAHPDYFSFAGIWDGTWYHIVAASGYPAVLPHTADGHIDQNAWAFLPAYPMLVGALSTITSLSFNSVGVFVSVGFAAGAALVFYKLLLPHLGASTSMFAVVLFSVAPLSPIFQVDYAESMMVFFLALSLLYLQRRQYWIMLLPVVAMAFTRPTGLAFALALGLHVVYRYIVRRREAFPFAEQVSAISATVIAGILGYAWPAIAGAVTGVPDAYTATELSWRAPYVGWADLVPFQPWIQGAEWWVGRAGIGGSTVAIVLLLVTIALFAGLMFTPPARRLGVDLRLWGASWVIYLLAVFFPQSSLFRLLVPLFPLLGALAIPRSRTYRVVVVLACILGQIGWIYIAYWVDGYDWTPP
ncbi:MAG TPA: hypothetical protein VGM94_08330 [Galbitalea sp.]